MSTLRLPPQSQFCNSSALLGGRAARSERLIVKTRALLHAFAGGMLRAELPTTRPSLVPSVAPREEKRHVATGERPSAEPTCRGAGTHDSCPVGAGCGGSSRSGTTQ